MEKLTLEKEQEIKGHLIETNGRVFLYMYEITMAQAFSLLIDPENTGTIQENRNGVEKTVTGYSHLYCISEENGGMICAGLLKEE